MKRFFIDFLLPAFSGKNGLNKDPLRVSFKIPVLAYMTHILGMIGGILLIKFSLDGIIDQDNLPEWLLWLISLASLGIAGTFAVRMYKKREIDTVQSKLGIIVFFATLAGMIILFLAKKDYHVYEMYMSESFIVSMIINLFFANVLLTALDRARVIGKMKKYHEIKAHPIVKAGLRVVVPLTIGITIPLTVKVLTPQYMEFHPQALVYWFLLLLAVGWHYTHLPFDSGDRAQYNFTKAILLSGCVAFSGVILSMFLLEDAMERGEGLNNIFPTSFDHYFVIMLKLLLAEAGLIVCGLLVKLYKLRKKK